MLKVQEYLQKNSLEQLQKDYAIEATHSPIGEPLVILNYCQIDSPKYSPITRECRGLVLDTTDWSVVAKPFSRFFNYGESREEINKFNWENFSVQTKEDGSLIILYYYKDSWRINTRASFGLGKVGDSPFTWEELFYQTINEKDLDYLDKDFTYIFELCSIYNKVVRTYPNPKSFLLGIFDKRNSEEIKQERVRQFQEIFPSWTVPSLHTFCSIEEIVSFLENPEVEATFEGFVIRDSDGNRIKIKNKNYLLLHRARGNSKDGSYNKKYIIPLILGGELDELKAILPEIKNDFEYYKSYIDRYYDETVKAYDLVSDLISQKDFANSVKNECLGFLCFYARKFNKTIKESWVDNLEKVSKILIGKIPSFTLQSV